MNDGMEQIDDYVSELRAEGLSVASAGFCGQVLRETLDLPDIETAEDYRFYFNQFTTMFLDLDISKFEPAGLLTLAIGFKLAVCKRHIPELMDQDTSALTNAYLDWVAEYSCLPHAASGHIITVAEKVVQ